jgi:hypothetical protein
MLNFSKNPSDHPDRFTKERPGNDYYVFKIVKSTVVNSKNGNPQWLLAVDIAEGNYSEYFKRFPIRWYQVTNNDVGEEICATVLKRIVDSNPGLIDANVVNQTEFDESKVTGLLIGGKLTEEKRKNKTYKTIDFFCDAEYARRQKVKAVQQSVETKPQEPVVNNEDVPF